MLKAALAVAQVLAVGAALAFVVLLFVLQPDQPDQPGGPAATGAAAAGSAGLASAPPAGAAAADPAVEVDAAGIYADRCASCHGDSGQGLTAPALSDGRVAARFPDIEGQVAVVADGRGAMPGFSARLSEDELRAVVRYTRSL